MDRKKELYYTLWTLTGFPGGLVVNNLDCQSRWCQRHRFDPWRGRSPGEGNGNPLQYSCLGNPMDRGAWQAAVHGVTGVGHNLTTKPPPTSSGYWWIMRLQINFILFFTSICSIWICTMSMYYCFHLTFPRVTCYSLVVGLPPADCLARNVQTMWC